MFEKEAQEYSDGKGHEHYNYLFEEHAGSPADFARWCFQDGAEFGYNKANEWHYPAKGEFPKASGNYILAFYGAEGSVASGKPCCEETYFDAELLRWKERDTYDDLPYLEKKGVVIAWRELPEPPKEEE